MRSWNLVPSTSLTFPLAADVRLGGTDYCDDQIWELVFGSGEPPALAVQTMYGLRARSMRLFPRFIIENEEATNPVTFQRPPNVLRFYPNYLLATFSPFANIDVRSEYWVPQSKAIAGRLQIKNTSSQPIELRFDWVAQLTPIEGERMAPVEIQSTGALCGETVGLRPVVFLTGGAEPVSSPYPALSIRLQLSPEEEKQLVWSHAALLDIHESFSLARKLAALSWDAEIARIEMTNSTLVEIYTGDPDWDLALALSQNIAYGLFIGPGPGLPSPSFALTRQPDQGYSSRGDGSDYNHLWNGQPTLESYYLTNLILPGAVELAKGLLFNILASQEDDGSIDWKPGIAGQRSHQMATPVLASMALRIYQQDSNWEFLQRIFPHLLDFLHAWFSPEHDSDEDGVPEWDHPLQSGLEDHPVFSAWRVWSQGVDIKTAESPSLCAFLYNECQTLIQIAEILKRTEPIPALQSMADHLAGVVENAWDERTKNFSYWDRDSHVSTQGVWLGERSGSGKIRVDRTFEEPIRLQFNIESFDSATIHPRIFIHGESISGKHRVEQIDELSFRWHMGIGNLTGERVYAGIEFVDIQGLGANDHVRIFSVDYTVQDLTLAIPLWARMLKPVQAAAFVQKTIMDPQRYWLKFGMPSCLDAPPETDAGTCSSAHLILNLLIAEGLLKYGYVDETTRLFERLMSAIIQNLKQVGAFRRYYSVLNGEGGGERNILNGLAPVGLFLETLGVRIISPRRVDLNGFNPFPWPITVKYQGLTVLQQKKKSTIIFPEGQTVEIDDPRPCSVSIDESD